MERQLNKTETYNSLANTISWGQRGEMRLPTLQDQMNRASCLRLVAAIVILFNAAYLQAAFEQERTRGNPITNEQLAHIFPTTTMCINLLDEYSFHDEPALATNFNELPLAEPTAEQLDLGL